MKTLVKYISLVLVLLSIQATTTHAQVISAGSGDIDQIINRPLIVELREMDEKLESFLEKKMGNAKSEEIQEKYASQKEDYENVIANYNEAIQIAVEKYFQQHESVTFKSPAEVEELKKSGSTEYTIMYYSDFTQMGTTLSIPTINYGRIETTSKKVDYSFYIPYTGHRDGGLVEKESIQVGDFAILFKLMQNHLEGIKDSGKKKYSFSAFAKNQASINCKDNAGLDLNIDELMIRNNQSQEKFNAAYAGGVNLLATDQFLKSAEEEGDQLVGLAIPLRIFATANSGSNVSVSSAAIRYMKCLVNTKTGKIYGASGEVANPNYGSKELQKLSACK